MYYECRPHQSLLSFVDAYWISDTYFKTDEKLTVYPDGCCDILIDFSEQHENHKISPGPFIVGAMTTYSEHIFTGSVKMLGIRFRPGGLSLFTRQPVSEFTDTLIGLQYADTLFDHRFSEELHAFSTWKRRLEHIDHYLQIKLPVPHKIDSQVLHSVNLIEKHGGSMPVRNVLKEICLCERQYERKFKAAVGYSPKMFSRIVRFKKACGQLSFGANQNLFLTAIDNGYYDDAHLFKDFKAFTGKTPAAYLLENVGFLQHPPF